ncbi:MAG: Rpn family recombination-promoting nuclease/putative transposase [Clostridia bacterium]|nr:Rpn family recombination-promoting nuclease/putative transposase [Clostridia bacterium]
MFILNYILNKDEEDFFSEYGILKKHANGRDVQLTNDLELYIIELPKLEEKLGRGEQIENKKLQTWLKFIINPNEVEETDMEENKELKKAAEELEYISEDEHERFLAEQRMEFIRLEKDLKDAGREEASREIAKNMLKKDMDIELIEEITGLTKEEIEKLK